MFTIEMDMDETAIVALDPEGKFEDIEVFMYDDIIYIRQWDEDMNRFSIIAVSPSQYLQLMHAFKLPAGSYMLNTGDNE